MLPLINMHYVSRNDSSTPGRGGEADRLGPDVWKIIAVTVTGAFMPQLSTTMVNVSLSSLGAELHASLSAIQWVTSGYLLVLALMLPLNGWQVERIGAKVGVELRALRWAIIAAQHKLQMSFQHSGRRDER
jgi:MFS family permease